MNLRVFMPVALKSLVILTIISFPFVGCFSPSEKKQSTGSNLPADNIKEFTLISPSPDHLLVLGSSVSFAFKPQNQSAEIDSVEVYIDGNKVHTERHPGLSFKNNTIFHKVGRQNIRFKIFYNHSQNQILSARLTVLSDTEPSVLKFKKLRQIPHAVSSYTEGLIYYNGFLYEGTGQKRSSKIMKIDPANGTTLKERKLEDIFFGEGITILNNKLYQLTYLSKVGFVYDLESFELIRKFDLQTDEGWGITNDGKNLILSDGTSVIYYYDPEYFIQNNQLDVCDQKGLVSQINELEFVKGFIWANIWGKPYIVKIDTKTGKILSQLDLKSLFPKGIPDNLDYVLNGIAYNPDTGTFYVTGKYWPVMYEIEIMD